MFQNKALISYADAVVLVYSITDRESFENVKTLIESVRSLNLNNIPIVVVGNKIDRNKKRQVSKIDGENLALDYDVKVFERSAAIPTTDVASVFIEVYKLTEISKKLRRDSDPSSMDPSNRMVLKALERRMSRSLDSNDFIKLVL